MPRVSTFTTYINAELDPNLEAAYSRQTQIATSSYAIITNAAKEASRQTAGLLGGSGTAGIGASSRALGQQAQSMRSVTEAAANAERQVARTGTSLAQQGRQADRATLANTNLSRSLNTTATSLAIVEGRMSPLAGRILTVARATEQLTGLQLGLAGIGAGLYALARAGNEYTVLQSRIAPFFKTQTESNKAFEDLIGIAQRSRASLESVVEVYSRLTSQAGKLGVSQQAIGRATEIASKAATLSGGTSEARSGALVQFSQALGANFRGSGQEFQSLAEGAPQLLNAIADGFKNANGTIGTTVSNLRNLASQGQLTSKEVLAALDRAAGDIDTKFSRLPATLNQAGAAFSNSLITLIGHFDRAVGLTSNLAALILGISNNLRGVVAVAVALGAALAGVRLIRLGTDIAGRISGVVQLYGEVKRLDAAWVQDAQVTATAYEARLAELENERVAVGQNILAIEARAKAEQAAATQGIEAIRRETAIVVASYEEQARAAAAVAAQARANGGVAITGSQVVRGRTYPTATTYESAMGQVGGAIAAGDAAAVAGSAQALSAEAEAAKKAATAEAELNEQKRLLTLRNRETEATTSAFAAAQVRLGTATENVGKRVKLLPALFGSLVDFLGGPLGIALGVATAAFYLFATSQTKAEQAADALRSSQASLADVIDLTTGKLIAQNTQLLRNRVAGAQDTQAIARQGLVDAKQNLFDLTAAVRLDPTGKLGNVPSNLPPALSAATATLLTSTSTAQSQEAMRNLQTQIDLLKKTEPGRAKQIDDALTDVVKAAGTVSTGAAVLRLYSGKPRAGDVARVTGERATGDATPFKPRTKEQLDADAQAAAAQTDLQRATAQLAEIRAEKEPTDEAGQKDYVQRYAAATQTVYQLIAAQKESRHQAALAAEEARKQASDAKKEQVEAAGSKRDQALSDLYAKGLNPQADEYKRQRDAILNTYDAEVAKIRGLKNEHTAFAAAQAADAKAAAAYAKSAGEQLTEILSSYDDAPRAVDKANTQKRKIDGFVDTNIDGVAFRGKTDDQIADIKKTNPLGTGLYTQAMAEADARRIDEGLRKPLRDVLRDEERENDVAKLRLAGRDDEAAALQRTYSLVDAGLHLSKDEFAQLVANEQQQERINDALESRQRIVSLLQGSVDAARETTEKFIEDLGSGKAGDAFKTALNSFKQRFTQINATALTEQLFAGADDKVRALIRGGSGVDSATAQYVDSLGRAQDKASSFADTFDTSSTKTQTALDKLTSAFELAAGKFSGTGVMSAAASAGIGGDSTSSTINQASAIANQVDGGSASAQTAAVAAISSAAAAKAAASAVKGDGTGAVGDPIVVTAQKAVETTQQVLEGNKPPSAVETYNALGKAVGGNLDKLVDKVFHPDYYKTASADALGSGNGPTSYIAQSQIFSKFGAATGQALAGAQTGALVNSIDKTLGISKALGLKSSATGAQIGGAIGSFIPIPGGQIIGAIAGSIIGGLFKKTPTGGSTIVGDQYGNLSVGSTQGNDSKAETASKGEAGSVIQGIQQVAQALGADISGSPNITVGTYKGKYRVNTQGTKLGGSISPVAGLTDFGDDEQAAIQYAVAESIQNGVIKGISQASINILKSGQDLQQAIQKATTIENIPKQLEALTDPVRYAVDTLNDQFKTVISDLKEGGATAAQYAQAQKLYDLDRAKAIKEAAAQAKSAIDDLLTSFSSTSDSPYNKLTVYRNAQATLNSFRSDIASGKQVDANDLANAAKNFEAASKTLNGSDSNFFSDFEDLKALLQKASANADAGLTTSTDTSALPASPFATDSTVQSAIAGLSGTTTAATQAQTATLSSKLDDVVLAIRGLGTGGVSGAIRQLPGFAKAA